MPTCPRGVGIPDAKSAGTLGLTTPKAEAPSFPPTADAVFLDSKEERQEYVLAQDGLIFQGSAKYYHGIPWNFGQVWSPPASPYHLRPPVRWAPGLRHRQAAKVGSGLRATHSMSSAFKVPKMEAQRQFRPGLRSHSKGFPYLPWEQQPQIVKVGKNEGSL